MKGVYAIGDVSDLGEMLAHVHPSRDGCEIIAGTNVLTTQLQSLQSYSQTRNVSVGMSDEAKEAGHPVITGKFPLAANGRSLTQEAEKTGGFVRVVAREDDHRILESSWNPCELVGEWTLALEMGALLEDIAGTIHAHPTMTEMTHGCTSNP